MHLDSMTAHFDFAPVSVLIDGDLRRLGLSCYAPDWAPSLICALDENTALDVLLWRLDQAFRSTGGVPDMLIVRQARPLFRGQDWADPVHKVGRHFGVQLIPDPSLGPLESPRHWLLSREHESLDECREELDRLFNVDAPKSDLLHPLPSKPYLTGGEGLRRVASDGFVRFQGDWYSVPFAYVARQVWIRRVGMEVMISSQDGRHLASHTAGAGRQEVKLKMGHFEATRRTLDRDLYALEKAFQVAFPQHKEVFSRLVAQRRNGAAATLRSLLSLTLTHTTPDVASAFDIALRYNNLSHRFIRGLLPIVEQTEGPELEQGLLF